jgi:dTDP-4-dehydrorhamnose reductase
VAGLPGVPGFNLFFRLRTRFPGEVFGIAPPHLPALAVPDGPFGEGLLPLDPENPADLEAAFRRHGFRSVLDASGWCALKPCEHDRALARRLNVDIGRNLAEAAARHGARLLRLSTDLVFDGKPRYERGALRLGGYTEDSPPSPVTVYGAMMAEAEGVIRKAHPAALVARIPLPMGPSLNGHAGAVDWIESRFRGGRPATLYFDEVRSNLYVQDLGRAAETLIASDGRGILHLGGPRPLSLFQIAQCVNRLGAYPAELLMGCPRAAAGPVPPRAGDVTLDSSRAEALLPAGTLGPWPRLDGHVPWGPEWHARRDAPHPPGSIERYLYGYGWPEAWDHPSALIPAHGRKAAAAKGRAARAA